MGSVGCGLKAEFLPTKNTKHRTFYRTHFLLISITCLSRYISLSFYRPALRCVIFFSHKGKSNISFGTVNGLLLFVCIHNINIVLL